MRAQYGPSLPLDQQLHRVLESQIFHPTPDLRAHRHLFRLRHHVNRLAREHLMVLRRLLLRLNGERPASIGPKYRDIGSVHAEWNHSDSDDHVFEVSPEACHVK